MTSDTMNTPSLPSNPQASAAHGGASQLWIRAGSWLVRADQVLAVGVHDDRGGPYRQDKRKYLVQVATTAVQGSDGEIEPAAYTVARFADKDDAGRCVSSVVERMGTWRGGYGILNVSDQGSVVTSRPRIRHVNAVTDPGDPADADRPDSATA